MSSGARTDMAGELMRGGTATARQRALIAQGAARFCRDQHGTHVAVGLAPVGRPCCPHCVLYPISGARRG